MKGIPEGLLVQFLCSRQCQLQQVAQDCVHFHSEYLQGRRLHNIPAQPNSVFYLPHRRKSFCMFKWNLVFQFDGVNEVGYLKEQWEKWFMSIQPFSVINEVKEKQDIEK